MSTVSSGNAAKGEKGKKYQSLNINSLFKVSGSESQQKSTAPKHGLQVLGKVPAGRRVPNPVHLPSLKSESGGQDPNVVLVPANSSGWVSGSEVKNGSVQTGNPAQPAGQPQTENKIVQPLGSPVKQQPVLKPQVPQAPPPGAPSASRGPPVAIQPGQLRPGGGQLPTSRPVAHYDRQFPTLGEQGKAATDVAVDQKQGPSLRPQSEGTWGQSGRAPPSEQQRYPNLGPVPEPEMGPPHAMAQGQGRQMPPMMHYPRGMPPPYMRPPPLGQFPPHFQMRNARPPMRGPPPLRDARQVSGDDVALAPILKQEELNKLDEIAREGGWAAEQDEIDYNQKLTFSDDEDHGKLSSTQKEDPEVKVARDAKWAENIQAQGKLIQQAKTQPLQTERTDHRNSGEAEKTPLDDDDEWNERRRQQHDQESEIAERARRRRFEEEMRWRKERDSVSSSGASPRVSESRDYPSDRDHTRDYPQDAQRRDPEPRDYPEGKDYPPRHETEREHTRDSKDYSRRDVEKDYRSRDNKDYRRDVEGKDYRPRDWEYVPRQDYGRREEPRDRDYPRSGESRRKDDWDREEYRDYGYPQSRDTRAYQRGHGSSNLPPRLQKQQEMRRQDSGSLPAPPQHGDRYAVPSVNKNGRPARTEQEYNRDYDRELDRRPPSREQRSVRRQDSDKDERRNRDKEDYEGSFADDSRSDTSRYEQRGYDRSFQRGDDYDDYGRSSRSSRYSDDSKRSFDRGGRLPERERPYYEREVSNDTQPESYDSREPEEIPSWADDSSDSPPPPVRREVENPVEEKPLRKDEELPSAREVEAAKPAEKEELELPKPKEETKEQETPKPAPKEEPVKPAVKPEPVTPREPPKRAEVSREPRPKLVAAKEEPLPKAGEKKEEDFARPRTWGGHSYKEERKHKGHAPLPISRERVEADIDNVLKQSIASQRKEKEPEKVKVEETSAPVATAAESPKEAAEPAETKEADVEPAPAQPKPTEVREEAASEAAAAPEPAKSHEKLDDKSSRGRGRSRDYDNRNKDYRAYDQRGRGNRPYSQPSSRGRNEYRGGRGGRYYYDDWEGDYDYPKKRDGAKGEGKEKTKAGKSEEKDVKDEKKEMENVDTLKKENVEEREEFEQERKSSGRGWESSRGGGRGGRGVNTRGRGSYGPPGSRPFSGEGEGSKDNRAPRFQKVDSSQRGRGSVGRKVNVPPPFSDKKAEDLSETAEEGSQVDKVVEEKKEGIKDVEKEDISNEGTDRAETDRKDEVKTEERSDVAKDVSDDKAGKKREEGPKREFSRPHRERKERRDDRRKDDYRDRRDDNRERRDDNRERRDDKERREKENRTEKKEENKENNGGEPHGKKHKEWDPSPGDEEKAKKPRREEKPAQRPARERRDSGRSAKAGYQRDTRHTTLPPRFAKLHMQRQKGFSDGSHASGFGPPPSPPQPSGIPKVDLNPPPPPPVNAWAKPITETLKQHAAAQQQSVPISQAPPQAPPTSVPPPFAPPQRRGEPVKVGQTLQSKPAEPTEPAAAPPQITGSLVFENTKIKAKNENQTEPIQLPFALSKPSEDLQLDFTFDASLHTEEKRTETPASSNPVGAKANVNLNLQRNIVASVQSPISPSTADLNLKIQSVKKVWDTMPTVVEHSGEEPAVSSSGPFGNAFGSPTNITSSSHVQGSEISDTPTEEFGGNQAGYVGGSSPSGKAETTAAKTKQQPSPPPSFGQHYTSVSSQASVMTQYQQYNTMPAIPSPPTTVLYSAANPQQIAGQQLLTQYQIDGTTVPISMQILNASSQASSRSVSAQYSAAQAYNLPVMSPNLSQFGSSGFGQQSIMVPPPNGAPLGTGSGQPTPPSGPEAVFGAQHVRVQTASYGQTSPSPNAAAMIIPGNKTATAQFGMGAQQGFGNIGKAFQQHPGSGTAQLPQNPFYIYEQTPMLGHLPANFVATPVLRNNLPPGPPPSGPTSFYSTTSTPAQSPFFQGQAGAQIQPPPTINQAAGSFGANQSFSLQGFSSHTPANIQGFGRNQNQISRAAPVNYQNIGLYKVGMLATAPDQLKQMAALGTNENLASQYLSSQGSIQLPTNGGILNSQTHGVQQPLSSPKNKDQRGNGVNGNRYGNGNSGFGVQSGSFKQQNTNVYSRPPAPVTYQHQQQGQSRFPAPIQRPAVSQAGSNQKSGKAMIGQGGGVSPVETFTSQGNGTLNEKLASDGNQELITRSTSEEALKKQASAETHADSGSKLEVNEVK